MNMNMSQSAFENPAKTITAMVVWAPTIQDAVDKAISLSADGWVVEGIPRPMMHRGVYGSAITVTKEVEV